MRPAIHLATILAFAACALPAHADAFDSFNDFCVASHGNADDAIAAADKAGWFSPPQAFVDRLQQDKTGLPDGQMRMLRVDGGTIVMVAGHGASPSDPRVTGKSCILAGVPGDWTGFAQRAATLASVPPRPEFAGSKDGILYIWREQNGARVPLAGPLDLSAMAAGGTISLMGIVQKGNSVSFVFFVTDAPK